VEGASQKGGPCPGPPTRTAVRERIRHPRWAGMKHAWGPQECAAVLEVLAGICFTVTKLLLTARNDTDHIACRVEPQFPPCAPVEEIRRVCTVDKVYGNIGKHVRSRPAGGHISVTSCRARAPEVVNSPRPECIGNAVRSAGSLLALGHLHVESAGIVRRLATSPAGKVGERARGVSVSALSPREGFLGSGLGALAGDGVGDDVLVDDLGLRRSSSSACSGLELLVQARVSRTRTVCSVRAPFPRHPGPRAGLMRVAC
jgi:hypothetical protein